MAQPLTEKFKKIPRTILGVTDLRRNPQKAFEIAKEKDQPILVTEFKKPQGILLSLKTFDQLVELVNRWEMVDALDSIKTYRKEKGEGSLKELDSLESLMLADED